VTAAANKLFAFQLRVSPDKGSDMPANLKGALVICYSAAESVDAGVRQAMQEAADKRLVVDELLPSAQEVDAANWDDYVKAIWPEFRDYLPSAREVQLIARWGGAFFGPFMAYER
jgi:hypothetical protein